MALLACEPHISLVDAHSLLLRNVVVVMMIFQRSSRDILRKVPVQRREGSAHIVIPSACRLCSSLCCCVHLHRSTAATQTQTLYVSAVCGRNCVSVIVSFLGVTTKCSRDIFAKLSLSRAKARLFPRCSDDDNNYNENYSLYHHYLLFGLLISHLREVVSCDA